MTDPKTASAAISDTPTADDKLGFERFAEPLAANIAAIERRRTPWTVGVYGEWGSGKTSFLKMVEKALKQSGIKPIWFDAWKYVHDDKLWAALIQTVFEGAKQAIPRRRRWWMLLRVWGKSLNLRTGLWEVARKLFVLLFRIAMLVLLVLAAVSLVPVAGNPVNSSLAALFGGGWLSTAWQFPGTKALVGVGALLGMKPDALLKLFDIKLGADFTKFRRSRSHREQSSVLEDFNTEFRHLLEVAYRDKPLVVVIDDLDRCLPEHTLQIIETLKLFLDEPGCVFLLAVDREVVEQAIAVKYKDLSDADTRRRLGETYFDKVVQLPYSLPPAAESAVEEFVRSLSADPDVHACVPILRGTPPYNPRRIKRSVQAFSLLKDLAGPALVPAVLAKLVIIQAQFVQVYRAAVDDPALLGRLERAYRDPEATDETDIVFVEQVKQFSQRYPALRTMMCHEVTEDDSFEGVSLDRYLSFVDAVTVVEQVTAGVTEDGPDRVLVSCVRSDARWGEWVRELLAGRGFEVSVTDPRVPGPDRDMASFDHVVGILSARSAGSVGHQRVLAAAIAARTRVVVVRVERCDVPEVLESQVLVDLVGLDDAAAGEVLVRGFRKPVDVSSAASGDGLIVAGERGVVVGTVVGGVNIHYPGSGAVLDNVPLAPIHLVSRPDVEQRISACFAPSGEVRRPTMCVLFGLGGSGKTTSALSYAHSRAAEYRITWWVRAEQARNDLAELATALGVPATGLFHELASRSGWLLVYDDADRLDDVLDLLPRTGNGHVLITSRNRAWDEYATIVEVGPLRDEEGVELLTAISGSEDLPASEALAARLGNLPLALSTAGAYLRRSGLDPGDYLTRLNDLSSTPPQETVMRTFQRSFDLLREANPQAEEVLQVLVLLTAASIPRDLAERLVPGGRTVLDQAIATLHQYGFVSLPPGGIVIHPIVSQAVHDGLTAERERELVTDALNRLGELSADALERFKPHVVDLIGHARAKKIAPAETAALEGMLR
ncbi:hypothetical protein ADK67_34095 [Saccharothrix sp. NRRL B-16348]|uniref:P-loop NTPase fold protein n=1 Tax=Saccharothrix sp. NRRL B-16348 TaxID=1415542 RepID=UPI0006AE932A|nr:P-loop NTPase fold protein [Saccharothrix sp. NRRL B-16348]KOX19191.1 hypothetical protein ADK67_34095 [Saccharothrix sp. NRRL B-16348]